MKENQFIEQNKEKWIEFEEERTRKAKDPSKLSKLFVQITDDLSYARSFYKNRQVRHLLNGMAQNLFLSIYKNDKLRKRDVATFWKTTLPLAVYRSRRALLFSFLLFVLSFCIGMLSSANDPGFSRMILSDQYVEMTLENIQKGEPMGVYKSMGEVDMMFAITLNNLMVSAITFVLGIFSSLGSVIAMVQNGVMVGAFQHFFIERGLFWESFLTIWQHGTLEISAIIIAGGAGIVLGKGLLFPGTYTRIQAFRISSKQGMVVLAGIAPIIIFAAFIESFFTRYTNLPDFMRVLVILISLSFIIFYFVIYPRKVARRLRDQLEQKEDIEYKSFTTFDLHDVHSGGQLFEAVLRSFGHGFSSFFKKIMLLSLSYIAVFGILNYVVFKNNHENPFDGMSAWMWIFLLIFNIISSLIFFYSVYGLSYKQKIEKPSFGVFFKRSILPLIIYVGVIQTIYFIPQKAWQIILFTLITPFALGMVFWWQHEKKFPIPHFFSMLKGEGFKLFWLVLKFEILALLLQLLVDTPVFKQLLTGILWNLYFEGSNMAMAIDLFTNGFNIIISTFASALAAISVGLFTFNMKEKYTATGLKLQIENIGKRHTVKGFEREV